MANHDNDPAPSVPSSLNLDRNPSAARTGQDRIGQSRSEQSDAALVPGDSDADYQAASTSGDEVPGGDNPTPDQNATDDYGRAMGLEYADGEELASEDKLTRRDEHRWELDPASSEDFNER